MNRVLRKLWVRTSELVDSVFAVVLHRHRPLGHVRRWRHPPVYRPLVDLSIIEERYVIITYRLDRATILELCAQLEPDLMSTICHPTGIPPLVQVLSWDPERRGWQPKDKNTRTERRAEKRSTRIRSRLRKRRDAGSAAEKRRRRKRDRKTDARSRRNDAQHR
ncbi:hypothetical protein NDU88_003800 [Pleurodeles waltl]|uniref:Uncharacterized protein n=1 Tax=Pleurodeles waltl TaxID=8319 RepID=A0AAV7UEA5_PLEWA|nr:hypothetical protein NDU88_003800 [Pleurodeles waltl]